MGQRREYLLETIQPTVKLVKTMRWHQLKQRWLFWSQEQVSQATPDNYFFNTYSARVWLEFDGQALHAMVHISHFHRCVARNEEGVAWDSARTDSWNILALAHWREPFLVATDRLGYNRHIWMQQTDLQPTDFVSTDTLGFGRQTRLCWEDQALLRKTRLGWKRPGVAEKSLPKWIRICKNGPEPIKMD